jgi:hypothetical protein
MAGADDQLPGAAVFVDGGVDFRRAPATRAANRLRFGPPFPPAAERWALMWVASIISAAGGPPAAAR